MVLGGRGSVQFGPSVEPKISSCQTPGLLGSIQLLLGILEAQLAGMLFGELCLGSGPSHHHWLKQCGRIIPTVENTSGDCHGSSQSSYFICLRICKRVAELPVQVRCRILDAWGWCTGTTQRDGMGREEGSGWGTHVYLWRIHFDIWQN